MTEPSETTPTIIPVTSKSVTWLIGLLEDGAFASRVSDALAQLNRDMAEHSANEPKKVTKGQITLTLDFELSRGIFDIEASYKVKAPKADVGVTHLFPLPNGGFSREHPKQLNMFQRGGAGNVEPLNNR